MTKSVQFATGSGKSTLLALLTGDHPQSFSEPITLFGKSRLAYATTQLQQNVGHISPEMSNAFPRRMTGSGALTAREAIGTGFDGIFCWRKMSLEQEHLIDQLILDFDYSGVLTLVCLSR